MTFNCVLYQLKLIEKHINMSIILCTNKQYVSTIIQLLKAY